MVAILQTRASCRLLGAGLWAGWSGVGGDGVLRVSAGVLALLLACEPARQVRVGRLMSSSLRAAVRLREELGQIVIPDGAPEGVVPERPLCARRFLNT